MLYKTSMTFRNAIIAVACLPISQAWSQQQTAQQDQSAAVQKDQSRTAQLTRVPKPDSAILMRAKLGCSQKIVEGLMAGDFAMIRKGAVDLSKICDSQHWQHHQDQVVTHYRSALKRSAVKLVEHSDTQNLEGAAYTYMHTLTTCIDCHKYARNVLRIADSPVGSPVISIPVTEQEALSRQEEAAKHLGATKQRQSRQIYR